MSEDKWAISKTSSSVGKSCCGAAVCARGRSIDSTAIIIIRRRGRNEARVDPTTIMVAAGSKGGPTEAPLLLCAHSWDVSKTKKQNVFISSYDFRLSVILSVHFFFLVTSYRYTEWEEEKNFAIRFPTTTTMEPTANRDDHGNPFVFRREWIRWWE